MSIPVLNQILVVDDEIDIQKIIEFTLINIGGFQVKTCSSGIEAINSLSEFKPDLILMDVMMPEMDGPTALKEIRKMPEYAGIPIIFVTAKVQPQEVDGYKAIGALHVIVKPFDPINLPVVIKEIWQKHYN